MFDDLIWEFIKGELRDMVLDDVIYCGGEGGGWFYYLVSFEYWDVDFMGVVVGFM